MGWVDGGGGGLQCWTCSCGRRRRRPRCSPPWCRGARRGHGPGTARAGRRPGRVRGGRGREGRVTFVDARAPAPVGYGRQGLRRPRARPEPLGCPPGPESLGCGPRAARTRSPNPWPACLEPGPKPAQLLTNRCLVRCLVSCRLGVRCLVACRARISSRVVNDTDFEKLRALKRPN